MPNNPTLPPSLSALFREYDERIATLERGDKSLNYRQMMTTNDASNARSLHMSKSGNQWVAQEHEVYSAALVNPRYPVLVARFHMILYSGSTAQVWFKSAMGSASRTTQRWQVNGGNGSPGSAQWSTFEIAWLHGMPTDQWSDTVAQAAVKRGNVEMRVNVTAQSTYFNRNEDFYADAQGKGFTVAQAEFMNFWFEKSTNRLPVHFREPEYAFLAPLSMFSTASPEGTLIPGSSVPGYSTGAAAATLLSERSAVAESSTTNGENPVWTNVLGEWPIRRVPPIPDIGEKE